MIHPCLRIILLVGVYFCKHEPLIEEESFFQCPSPTPHETHHPNATSQVRTSQRFNVSVRNKPKNILHQIHSAVQTSSTWVWFPQTIHGAAAILIHTLSTTWKVKYYNLLKPSETGPAPPKKTPDFHHHPFWLAPSIRSESAWFIWHPMVTTWEGQKLLANQATFGDKVMLWGGQHPSKSGQAGPDFPENEHRTGFFHPEMKIGKSMENASLNKTFIFWLRLPAVTCFRKVYPKIEPKTHCP